MKKNKFQMALEYIENNKAENLKKLTSMPLGKLYDLKKYYYDWYRSADENDYLESAIINKKHHDVIEEAIKIVERK